MSVRNGFVLLLALSALTFLVACGSNSPKAVPPPSGGFTASDLKGTYVFSSTGLDSSGAFLAIAGAFAANGSGGITSGTMDIVDPDITPTSPVAQGIPSGSYSITADGRGTVKLGAVTLDFVLTSSSHGLVTEFDGLGSGSGTIDLQSTAPTLAQLAGPYAFSFAGVDGSLNPTATMGSFTLGTTGNLTTGVQDFNDDGFPFLANAISPGTITLGTGTGPASTTLTTTGALPVSLAFDIYPIDATHMKFIETDYVQFLAGDAFTQVGASIPNGPMAFTTAGLGSSGPVATGGLMTSDGTGGFTGGLEDVNNAGTLSPAQLAFSGVPAPGGAVGGRVIVNLSGFTPAIQWVIYPINGGILMLETDSLAITAGTAYAQTGQTIQASQGYGLNLSGSNSGGFEEDDIAEFTTTSTGFSGLVDLNDEGTLTHDKALTGSYAPDSPATGRGSATTNFFNYEYYVVSGSTVLILESDSTQVGVGTMELQATPGAAAVARPAISIVHPATRTHTALRQRK